MDLDPEQMQLSISPPGSGGPPDPTDTPVEKRSASDMVNDEISNLKGAISSKESFIKDLEALNFAANEQLLAEWRQELNDLNQGKIIFLGCNSSCESHERIGD